MKQVFFLTAIFFTVLTFGQDIPLGKNKFKADFTVDSVTLGVESNQVNVSGDVGGGYGRVYLSYIFTNKMETEDAGEFTGLAWTQAGENFNRASLQGIWKRNGKIFELYTFDNVTDGKKTVAKGILDMVNKTLKFEASQFE
ncbi:MAG: hypothetical protein CNC91_00485 [Flavobacteriales bacterium MED-G22]|jgi:hypothetical protein|nr:hypothetical protein [Flavobacteriaceae bacterium]PDH44999.1 MAG: hypothetical protein CNC91_00485 [Flavobacteriales bacterium MED-G22]|tara:strand:- start:407 stop:829 length:423 start_codon:yes stop_codon:yes gene_type:complete